MAEQSVIHSTFVIERSYPKSPERVFVAFADPAKKRRWFAEGEGHDLDEFEVDFRIGGSERVRYRLNENTPFPGIPITHQGRYQDIVPNKRIVTASTMDFGEKRATATLLTVEFLPASEGTDLIITHQGAYLEWPDGSRIIEAGWRKLVDTLAAELARDAATA